MSVNAFIDTNIFVYAHISTDTAKHKSAQNLLKSLLVGDNIFVSTQVLGEFYVAMAKYGREHDETSQFINEITRDSNVIDISLPLVESCLNLKSTYGYSYWDSLIIAAALRCDCSVLYSEDMQHNQLIENRLTILNPFASHANGTPHEKKRY